ncbi:MAG: 50S ribosomal protein L5 [bacterium]|nr:50S ribosomal protein L5 [bacterium]
MVQDFSDRTFKELSEKYQYDNVMQVPDIVKIILHRGLGEAIVNTKCIDISMDQLAEIAAQKPVLTIAKKSISNFKLREGQINGVKVTLRGKKAKLFLIKLIHLALPKIRDFRGVSPRAFDGSGNYNLGLADTSVFPEANRETDRERGLDITIVTSAKTDDEAMDLLKCYGMPFRVGGKRKLA